MMIGRVYLLRFSSQERMEAAFALISDSERVMGCSLEVPDRQIRFVAERTAALALVSRIGDQGGLVWCTGHDLKRE